MKSHTLTRGVAMFGALMLWPASTAVAAGTSTATGENTPLGPAGPSTATHVASGGASIVRTIAGLFIVIAVIYGIAWILKQAKKGKTRPTGNGLSQVASLPLGSGRSVTVVRAGREVIVVGVAENGVTPLRTYSEEEALALGIDVPPEDDSAPAGTDTTGGRMLNSLRRMTVRS
jgi:flagellar protein FliO/FliZ